MRYVFVRTRTNFSFITTCSRCEFFQERSSIERSFFRSSGTDQTDFMGKSGV
jgi:hypothetical protein